MSGDTLNDLALLIKSVVRWQHGVGAVRQMAIGELAANSAAPAIFYYLPLGRTNLLWIAPDG